MNKKLKIFLVICGILIGLPYLLMSVGVFQISKTGSGANEPAIQMGDHILYSKLITPERLDHICFKSTIWNLPGEYTVVFRLCGLPNDSLEMRNGKLYVNSELIDNSIKLKHNYKIATADYSAIKDQLSFSEDRPVIIPADSMITPLLDSDVSKFKIRAYTVESPSDAFPEDRFPDAKTGWTTNNFGPLKVPEDSYFVLGDNRDNAADSRYIGFIKKSAFVGTVFLHF